MTDLAAFLTERLHEDEKIARTTKQASMSWGNFDADGELRDSGNAGTVAWIPYAEDRAHIARWDPARVLAEIAAKRAIVKRHTTGVLREYRCPNSDHIQEWQCERAGDPYEETRYCEICPTGWDDCELRLLAAIYADHPDFDPGWRVC